MSELSDPKVRAHHHARLERVLLTLLAVVALYTAIAYLLLPALWTHYEHQKGLANLPMVTRTAQGIPGDAINVGLIGNEKEVLCAMNAAKWYPADPVTFRSSIEIAGSVLLDRAYPDAPVSNLFYLDRREDLAFEKPAGNSADTTNATMSVRRLEPNTARIPLNNGYSAAAIRGRPTKPAASPKRSTITAGRSLALLVTQAPERTA